MAKNFFLITGLSFLKRNFFFTGLTCVFRKLFIIFLGTSCFLDFGQKNIACYSGTMPPYTAVARFFMEPQLLRINFMIQEPEFRFTTLILTEFLFKGLIRIIKFCIFFLSI